MVSPAHAVNHDDADGFGDVTDSVLDADPYADLPLTLDAEPPADDEAESPVDPAAGDIEPLPSTPTALRKANPDLYRRCLAAGLIRALTTPSELLPETLLPCGTDISLEQHLAQMPQGALPEPTATDVDVAAALVSVIGTNRLRYYQPKGTTAGGTWQAWMSAGWSTVTDEWVESLVEGLIHPADTTLIRERGENEEVPPPEVPQRVRPVTLSKLTVEKLDLMQQHGLIDMDPITKSVTIIGTTIEVQGVYRAADDWAGRASTAGNIVRVLKGRLSDRRDLDAASSRSTWTLNIGGYLLKVSPDSLVGADGLRLDMEPMRRHHLVSESTAGVWNPDLIADPQNRCPNWARFVRGIMSVRDEDGTWRERPDHEVVLQKLAGLLLVPAPEAHRAAVFYGDHGNNGKSLCADTLIAALGGYGTETETLYISKGAQEPHPTGLMSLIGARGTVMHEMQPNEWHGTRTKRFITDQYLHARSMGKDMASYSRTHTLLVTANDLPAISGDSGFWKRLVLFHFQARWYAPDDSDDLRAISIGPMDDTIEQKLREELDGILLWMLEGLYLYYTEGLELPEEMLRLKRTAMGGASTWGLFVEDHIEFTNDPADYLDDNDLWTVWKHYVDEVLQGKFENPNKPGQVRQALIHALPQAVRRGRSREGAPRSEKNGFGGIKWTDDEGLSRAKAAGAITTAPATETTATVTPLFGGGVKK